MYINLIYLQQKNISVEEFCMLQIIKQNRIEENVPAYIRENMTEDLKTSLQEKSLIKLNKASKKSDDFATLVRITAEANKLLEIGSTPDVEEGDEKMATYLIEMYMNKGGDRSVGNRKNVIKYTAQFRKEVGLTLYEMYWLCDLFVSEMKYTLVLEKIFFDTNRHRYGMFINHVEDSKLYQFYDENREQVRDYWAIKIKK